MAIYSCFNSVDKRANLAIHVFLLELEKWIIGNGGINPEIVFIQVDGDSENANQFFLGMLEFLVHKRIAGVEVVYTRLPAGHTHSDIDGGFGHLSNYMRGNHFSTLSQFKNGKIKCI